MSITQFAGGPGGLVISKTHDMTSTLVGTVTGFNSLVGAGSMVPPSFQTSTWFAVQHDSATDEVLVSFTNNAFPQSFFDEIRFKSANDARWNNKILRSINASFLVGTFAQWTFSADFSYGAFLDGGIYELEVTT